MSYHGYCLASRNVLLTLVAWADSRIDCLFFVDLMSLLTALEFTSSPGRLFGKLSFLSVFFVCQEGSFARDFEDNTLYLTLLSFVAFSPGLPSCVKSAYCCLVLMFDLLSWRVRNRTCFINYNSLFLNPWRHKPWNTRGDTPLLILKAYDWGVEGEASELWNNFGDFSFLRYALWTRSSWREVFPNCLELNISLHIS